jgi:Lrp/AsnC family transcriptional regulator for asnA, asnC and gidA
MDQLDRKILISLGEDARKPLARVADELEVANTTVHQRVRRLEEHGVIRGSRLVVDWDAAGLPVLAVVFVEVDEPGSLQNAADRFATIPYVQSCHTVTGEFDLLVVVRATSSNHLGELLEELRGAVHGRSRTHVVLSTFFDGRVPPFAAED